MNAGEVGELYTHERWKSDGCTCVCMHVEWQALKVIQMDIDHMPQVIMAAVPKRAPALQGRLAAAGPVAGAPQASPPLARADVAAVAEPGSFQPAAASAAEETAEAGI